MSIGPWGWSAARSAAHVHAGNPAQRVATLGVLVVSAGTIALLVQRLDTSLVVVAMFALLGAAVLVLWPDIATLVVAFLLYSNAPALAARQGAPVLLTSAFILLLGLPLLHYLIGRGQSIKTDATLWWMLLYMAVLFVSAVGAKNPVEATDRLRTYVLEGFVLYWLVVNVIRTRPTLRHVIWTLVGVGALLGALTLYQEATGNYEQEFYGLVQRNNEYLELMRHADDPEVREMLQSFSGGDKSERPGGPVNQPNRFAQILLVLLPLGLFLIRTGHSRASRLWAFGCSALIVVGVALTQSRGAFLILVLATIAFVCVSWVRISHVVLGAVLFFTVATAVIPSFVTRIQSIAHATALFSDDTADQGKADGAIRGRTTVMLAALHIFMDHPVIGVGPGQFTEYVLEYSSNPNIKFRQLKTTRRAHNLYLELAADLGVIGLTVFLVLVSGLARALWRRRREWLQRDPESSDLATACCLMLAVYMATGMFEHLSYERYFWFLLAVASSALHLLSREPRNGPTRRNGRGELPLRRPSSTALDPSLA